MFKKLFAIFFITPHGAMENIGFYGHCTSNTMSAGLSQDKGAQLVKAMENQKKYANKISQLSIDGKIIDYHHCNYVEKNPLLDQQYFYMEKSDGILLLVGNHYQLESIWLLDNDNQTINGQFNRQNQREFCFFLNKLTWESKQCLMISFPDKDPISFRDKDLISSRDKDYISFRDKDYISSRNKDSISFLDKDHISSRNKDSISSRDKDPISFRDKDLISSRDKDHISSRDKDHLSPLLFFPVVNYEPVELYLKNNFYCKTLLDQYLEDQYYKLVNDDFIEYYETNEFNSQLDFNIVNAIKSRLSSYSTDIFCLCLVFIFYWASTFFKVNEFNYLSILFFFN
jgi:hypothetical protein